MSAEVEFGLFLTVFGEKASPENFRRVTETAEESGFDAVWAGDHVAFPEGISGYPFSPSGEFPFDASDDAYDVFQVLSYLASVTDSINLGTNTCVAPYRHPIVTTRNAFTAEQLTDGRFDFGVAAGWMESEFEVLDVPYEERGSRMDEFLEIFTRARREGELAFDGQHHSFQKTGFHPIPEEDRPNVWIGGTSGAAIRRVGQYGDGWTTIWSHPDELEDERDRIMNAWDDFDREGEPEIALMRPAHVGTDTDRDTSSLLVGPADDVISDVEAYADAGVTRIILASYLTDSVEDQVEQIRRISDQVLPSF